VSIKPGELQSHPRRPLVIELDRQAVQSDGLVILHPQADLLTQAATAGIGRFLPAQEVILVSAPDEPALPHGWIETE
jgi:hypothetical protein